jgi:GT2 family glycosyltransferase
MSDVRITAIVTSFNRKPATLACLGELQDFAPERVCLTTFVVDDASTDGTAEAVRLNFPAAVLLEGNGCDYWAASVLRALEQIAIGPEPEYIVLVNDDFRLQPDAIERLLKAAQNVGGPCIVGGAVGLPGGKIEKAGRVWNKVGVRNTQLKVGSLDQRCDAVPGHAMLFSYSLLDELDMVRTNFTHGFFDTVLCARARKRNIPVIMVNGVLGQVEFPHHYGKEARAFILKTPNVWHALRYSPKAPPFSEVHSYFKDVGGPWRTRSILCYRWHFFGFLDLFRENLKKCLWFSE